MLIYEDGNLKIHRLLLNEIKTNCFILQRGNKALLVDPTNDADAIVNYLESNKLELELMITTHGHYDHVAAAAGIIEKGLAEVLYVHEKDFSEIKNGPLYSRMVFKRKMVVPKVAAFNSQVFDILNNWDLCVEHAGGHTKGSCFIYDKKRSFVITGDLVLHHKLTITLFNSRENIAELSDFIDKAKNMFAPETIIFPGHGDRTTMLDESEHNKKWAYVQSKEGKI